MFTEETWKFINTFAPWFSAIGTISAVILSLYLARRDKNVRLEVSAGHRLIISPGDSEPFPEYLSIYVVNVGHREAQLTNIGWKVGIFKKRYAVQSTINDGLSSPLPVRLKDGEEAKYLIPLNDENDWLKDFIEKMLSPNPKIQSRFARIQAFTSIGKTFESKIESSLIKKISEKVNEK
nr:hypothetical protein [uncultured Methylophaga sp.]